MNQFVRTLRWCTGIAALLVLTPARAQYDDARWKPLGPVGGTIYCLTKSEQSIYAGGYGNVFELRLGNDDNAWTSIQDSLPQGAFVNDLVIAQQLYAATSNGVFTYDRDKSFWKSLNDHWPEGSVKENSIGPDIQAIAFINGRLYAGSKSRGLFEFVGASWRSVPGVPANAEVYDIEGNSEVRLAATSKGLYRFGSGNWQLESAVPFVNKTPNDSPNLITSLALNDQNEFCAAAPDGIYLLTPKSTAWEKFATNRVNANINISSLYAYGGSLDGEGKLFAGAGSRIYRVTRDNATNTNWAELKQGFGVAGGVRQLLVTQDVVRGDFMFAANDVGVNRTGLDGIAWTVYNKGLINTNVTDVYASNDTLYAAMAGTAYVKYGENGDWTELRGGFTQNTTWHSFVKHLGKIYCATTRGVFSLANNPAGPIWERVGPLPSSDLHALELATVGNHLFVRTNKAVYRSSNQGDWVKASEGLPTEMYPFEKLVVFNNDLYFFKTVQLTKEPNQRAIYRSTNLGTTWQEMPLPFKPGFISGLTVHEDELYGIFMTDTKPEVNKMYRYSGGEWKLIGDVRAQNLISNGNGSLFSTTTRHYNGDSKWPYQDINLSRDKGAEWVKINNARLPGNIEVNYLRATPTHLYAATRSNGVWVLPISDVYPPEVATGAVAGKTATTATITGTGSAEKFPGTFAFEYSTDAALGQDVNVIRLHESPVVGAGLPLSAELKNLLPKQTYYYRLTGSTSEGQIRRTGAIQFFETDTLTVITGQKKPAGEVIDADRVAAAPVQVSVTLNEGYQPGTKVFLRARNLRSGKFTERIAVPPGSREFTAALPASLLGEIGLQYYFEVEPPAGYGKRDTTEAVTVAVRHSNGKSIDGLDFRNKKYQLLAFPLQLDDSSASAVLGDELRLIREGPAMSKWRLVTYKENSFRNLEAYDPLVPGEAYWLATTEKMPAAIHMGSGKTVAHHPGFKGRHFDVALAEDGWTLVGNPFLWDVKWSDILAANGNPGWKLVTYQDGKLSEGGTLPAFGGAYVRHKAGSPVTLKIPVGDGSTRLAVAAPAAPAAMPLAVAFTVQSGEVSTQVAGLGLHPQASAGADEFDLELPPAPGGMPVLRFAGPAESGLTRSIVPVTGEGQSWEFTITGTDADQPVTLSWAVQSEPGRQLWLHDLAAERKADMLAAGSHSFRGPGRFRVYYGTAEYVARHLQPERNLVQAYPNPFARNTSLRFTLPPGKGACRVRMTLLDPQGRRLGTVAEGTYGSGFHQVEVPLGRLPAGVYTVEATFDGEALRSVQHLKLVRQ